ncbi:hypothetical protein [Tardiphaga sp. 862_B3_N1_1]|uniref:hypothetical protein n=1 Tax=Tardiphaga sp. 862_B3_N1_1 TaxID=3240763 RepID=UPI003F8BD7DA
MRNNPGQLVHLAVLMEEAIQIAWDYLERAGEIEDAEFCSHVLLHSVEKMVQQGVRSRLLLSNRAITQYMEALEARTLQAAS